MHCILRLEKYLATSHPDVLEALSISKNMAVRTAHGAIAINTGKFTRSQSRGSLYCKRRTHRRCRLVGGDLSINPFDPAKFQSLKAKICNYLNGKDIYVRDAYAGAHPSYRLVRGRVINEYPWSNQLGGQHVYSTYGR